MGRAKANRLLEIGTHTHAEDAEPGASGDLAQQCEMWRGLLVERRNAHQAFDRQAEPIAALYDERVRLGGHDSGFLRFLAGVDLDQAGRATPGVFHFLGQGLSEPRPVDRFDHIENRNGVTHLVRLQRPDQVQGEIRKLLAQDRILCLRLLDAILAVDAMTGRERLAHNFTRMGFGDGDETDAAGRSTGRPRGCIDPLPDGGEIGCDNPFHSSSIPGKDRSMSATHYRLSAAFAASLSLALAACAGPQPVEQSGAQPGATDPQKAASTEPEEMDTEATIWTVLGLAKKESVKDPGPKTGRTVSPLLWQAAHDTLDFVKYASEDPLTGSIVTDWYSPPDKPNERFRINVFILSRALRSDSLTVTVDRQELSANGQWAESTIAKQVETDLETTILNRARQLKRAWAAAPS
jgi:hypothetical protein